MFMSQPRNGTRIVNRSDLASLCGVSLPTVDAWVERGCPFVERGSKGREWKFDSALIFQWRIDEAVSDAAAAYGKDGAEMSREEADRRRAVATAHIAEIEWGARRRSTVSRADAVAMMADFCLVLKTGIANGMSKIASRAATMTNAAEIEEFGKGEWNRAMQTARAELNRLWDERFGTVGAKPPTDT